MESPKFVSHEGRTSEEFDLTKYSHPIKWKQRPWIMRKLSFRELNDSMLSVIHNDSTLSVIHTFENMAISLGLKAHCESWGTDP